MKISGKKLKRLIQKGLENHGRHLTLHLDRILQDFCDRLDEDKEHDLFGSMAELVLNGDTHSGPLIADLMRAVDSKHEILDPATFSEIGYFFTDYLKKEKALRYFRNLKSG